METKERYELPECPQNGHSADSDAPAEPAQWWEADRVMVHLVLAKRQGHERLGSVKIGEMSCLTSEQGPMMLVPEPEKAMPFGEALETFIAQMREKANKER